MKTRNRINIQREKDRERKTERERERERWGKQIFCSVCSTSRDDYKWMQRLSTGCISVKANKMWKQTKINHTFTFLTWCENFVFKCVNTCNSMYKLSMELMTFVIIILKSFKKALLNWIITIIAMKTFNMKFLKVLIWYFPFQWWGYQFDLMIWFIIW